MIKLYYAVLEASPVSVKQQWPKKKAGLEACLIEIFNGPEVLQCFDAGFSGPDA